MDFYHNGKLVSGIKAQVDTGNTVVSGLAISKRLLDKLGQKTEGKTEKVRTAKQGVNMKSYGVSKPLNMSISGLPGKTFRVQPRVLDDLSDDCNIGTGFLMSLGRKNDVEIRFTGDRVTLVVNEKSTELCNQIADTAPTSDHKLSNPVSKNKSDKKDSKKETVRIFPERKIRRVVTRKKEIIPRNSLQFITVDFEGRSGYTNRTLVEPVLTCKPLPGELEVPPAVYLITEDQGKIAVANHGSEDLVIDKGCRIGKFTELCKEKSEQINRIKPKKRKNKILSYNPEGTDLDNTSPPPVYDEEDVKRVFKELDLDNNEYLKQSEEYLDRAKQLVREFVDVFSSDKQVIGVTDLIEFEIELKENARPVKSKSRPLNPKQEEDLKRQLDLWEKEGVIEKADLNCDWSSPLVPALKKDGSIRWACDYRQVNACTVKDNYPLPSVESNIEKLGRSKLYSALDSASAYNTIPVKKSSRKYLAFISPFGLYQPVRMPFGASNSGATYSRLVQIMLDRVNSDSTLAYLDDIITHTVTFEQHMKELRKALQAHRDVGLKLRGKKTHLFQTRVDYLGYHISEKGIEMIPKYVEKIVQWPTPCNQKELATFIGFTSFYRSFIKDYSKLTNEMHKAKTEKTWEWTDVMDKKFKILKEAFSKSPIRGFPDYHSEEPFMLSVDFSKQNLAAVLTQKQRGEDGELVERFLACAGRKTTKYEANYASSKGELAACMFGLRAFEHLLRFRKFILYTDNSGVTWLQKCKNPRGITFRWLNELQSYDFEIKHKPGKKNILADSLSRSGNPGHLPAASQEEEAETSEYIYKIKQFDLRLDSLMKVDGKLKTGREVTQEMNMSMEDWQKAQDNDPVLSEVKGWLRDGRCPSKRELEQLAVPEITHKYRQQFERLTLINGILYQVGRVSPVSERRLRRLVVPQHKYETVFYWAHSHLMSGHFGSTATYDRAVNKFYWPGMLLYLKQQVGMCGVCLAKVQKPDAREVKHCPLVKGYLGEMLYVDLVGPLPRTKTDLRYILTIEDAFTKYVHAVPIKNKEAATVATALFDGYIAVHGAPVAIHSDNGKEFVSSITQELARRFGISWSFTAPYSPQSNPVERFHRTLNQMFRCNADRESSEWARFLPAMCLAYNTKVHSSTRLTPFFSQFGRECNLPIDLIVPSPEDKRMEMKDHVRYMVRNYQEMYRYIRANQQAVIRRNARSYSGNDKNITVGSSVYYLSPVKMSDMATKYTDQWLGPYEVKTVLSENILEIQPRDYAGNKITVHRSRLVPCEYTKSFRVRNIPAGAEIDPADEEGEELHVGEDRPLVVIANPEHVPEMVDHERVKPARGRPRKFLPLNPIELGRVDQSGMRQKKITQHFQAQVQEEPGPVQQQDPPGDQEHLPWEAPWPAGDDQSMDSQPGESAQERGVEESEMDLPVAEGRVSLSGNVSMTGGSSDGSPAGARGGVTPGREGTERKRPRAESTTPTPARSTTHRQAKKKVRLPPPPREPLDTSEEEGPSAGTRSRVIRRAIRKKLQNSPDTESDIAVLEESKIDLQTIEVALLRGSLLPVRGTKHSAAYDLQSAKKVTIPAGGTAKIPLNIKAAIPSGWSLLLLGRSGLSLKGIYLTGGLVDCDFRGEICAILSNATKEDFVIQKGQRCAQAIALPVHDVQWKEVDSLPEPDCHHAGFGSTG